MSYFHILYFAKATSILERPNDTRKYVVWVGFSTVRMTWAQMTNRQRLYQIEAERRAEHIELNRIYA
jgi:hypothetical protein